MPGWIAALTVSGVFFSAVLAGSEVRAEVQFAYSPVEPEKCLLYLKEPKGEGRVCAGVRGYNLVLTEFDDRAALELVRSDWDKNAIIPVGSVAPEFSWFAGKVAEWRLGPEGPFAMILRIGVAPTRQKSEQAETRLLVVKLPKPGAGDACLVGAVSGRSGANEAARAMADQAAGLPCLR